MSLINDAIKRAGQTPSPPPNPAQTTAGMRPIDYERPSRFPWVIVISILTPVFGLAIWFIVKGWELSQAPPPRPAVVVANARIQPVATVQAPDAATVGFQVAPTPIIVTQVVAAAAEASVPTFPKLRLQGIYWRPARPSAVINGKTVYIGDKVEAVRVTAMDQESVTLQWQSETKVLTLR
jgi:hypothetical protein